MKGSKNIDHQHQQAPKIQWNYKQSNPFNSSKNLLFFYSQQHINTISNHIWELYHRQGVSFKGIITNEVILQKMQTEIDLVNDGEVVALYLKNEMWYFYFYRKEKDRKINAQSNKDLLYEEGQINSCLFGLIHLKNYLCQQEFQSPTYLSDLLQIQAQLGTYYMEALKRSQKFSSWQDQSYEIKRKWLSLLRPRSREQFLKMSGFPKSSLDYEINQLCTAAIDQGDHQMVKLLLESGFRLKFLRSLAGEHLDIYALLKKVKQENPKKQDEYSNIEKILNFYGISTNSEVQHKAALLKKAQTDQVLNNLADRVRRSKDIFQSFFVFLQKAILGTVNTLQVIASGRFSVYEDNSANSIIDSVISAIFEKVPVIGSSLASKYSGFRNDQRIEFGKRIIRKLPIDSKEIAADFSIRVVETYCQRIVDVEEMSIIAELKEYFRKKISNILKYNEKQFVFDGHNFTVSWMILSAQFVGKFIDFLSSEEANESPSTLGIRAAFHCFGYHRVSEQQFSKLKLSTTYQSQNALILCKLASYITDISKYPNSLNSFGTVYWSDTKLQPEKIRLKAESAIIVAESFALFIFNSSSKVNLEKKKTKKCSKISISQDLYEEFEEFLDLASFKESKGSKSWSITKLLDSVSKKKDFKFVLVGYKLGAVIASLLHCVLAQDYQHSVDSIISYNFDIPLWCHKSSLLQSFDKLKYFYSVFISKQAKSPQKSEYAEIGKRFYLKGGQKQNKNGLQQFIFVLENQQNKQTFIRNNSNIDRKEVEEEYDSDEDFKVIFTEQEQYDEKMIEKAIRDLNYSLFKYLINLYNVRNKQQLNNYLSQAINHYPTSYYKQQPDFQHNKRKSFKLIKYLIQVKNCDPNQLDSSSRSFLESNLTHLQYALFQGFFELSKYLIQKGGDLNRTFRKGYSNYNSLSLAIQSGCVQLVKYLIEEKKMRMDNLWLEGRKGNINRQIMYILLKNGADPNTSTRVLGHTIFSFLNIAIQINDIDLIKMLLEKGADPNLIVHVSLLGMAGSAVHSAARNSIRVLKLLLEYGGNINLQFTSIVKLQSQQKYNKTPLDYLKEAVSQYQKKPQYYEILNYLSILKMQGHIANEFFEEQEYNQIVEFLLQQDILLHTILTYFVSQFLYTESLFNRKAATKQQDKYRKHFDTIRKFMFEGSSKIQRYNTAVRYLYSFHDPKRHEQVFKICDQNLSDEDFIFLKAVTYLQLLGPSNDSAKNEFFLEKIQSLKNSIQKPQLASFVEGQIHYFKGEINSAIYKYKQSESSNYYFLHPKIKLLKISAEYDSTVLKQAYQCWKILPIQLASILEDFQDIIKTDQFLQKYAITQQGVDNRQSKLQHALKSIFSVNPIIIRDRLSDLIPQKVFKMSLTINTNIKGKQTNFSVKGLLKEIDYAYSLLKSHKPLALVRIFSKKQDPPSSKESSFFQGITEVVKKLVALHQTIQNKCSENRDFKNPKDYEICLGNISDLIEYYDSYILRVIHNYNKDRDGNYQKLFYEKIGKVLDIKRDIIIYGERNFLKGKSLASAQPYSIMRQEAERLTASSLESDQIYGTHTVILLPLNSPNQIYFKHKPYAPGVQYAVSSLYKLILPNTTPETTLIKVVKGKQESIFLASAAITGRNFAQIINQTHIINTIDIKNFSSLFFCSFLVCTGDSKPDNFVLHFNYDSNQLVSTELVSIDNDIAFYRRGLKVNESSRKIYSDMLNVLYLLPQMAMPVSPYLKEYLSLKENQPQIIVAKWLGSLHEKNRIYQGMTGFTADDLKTVKLPIRLPRGTAAKVYSILKKIRSLISYDGVTHAEIFQHLSPSLAYFYNKYRDTSSTVNSLKNLYMAAGADPNIVNSLYSFDKNINSKAWNTLSSAKRKEEGSFNSLFNSSIREEAELFIEAIDFKVADSAVLEALCKQLPFVENLSLKNATQVQACKIVDSSVNGIKNLKMNQFFPADLGRGKDMSEAHMAEEVLPIESIFDILNLSKIPNRQSILRTLLSKQLSINEQKSNGQTILFQAANLICSNKISLNEGEKLLNALLDCGANPNITNKNSLKMIELEVVQRKCPQIIIIVLRHQPTFFKNLLRQGKIQEAQMIAESSSMRLFLSTIQEDGEASDESSALREVFKDRKHRHLAQILISKLQENYNSYEQDLVYIFVQNYLDEDAGLLQNFLNHKQSKASVLLNYVSYLGYYPADIAYKNSRFGLLTVILNSGGGISPWLSKNTWLAYKASQFRIKLDINDVSHKYDHKKVSKEGFTVLELMARYQDPDTLAYLDLVQLYKERLRKIALSNNFIELIEALFTEQELGQSENGHPLAKSEVTKQLSKLLAKHGFRTTLREALTQIDLLSKFDSDGNTVLMSIGLKYHNAASETSRKELLQQIKLILGKLDKGLLQVTMREDGNTLLHLAAQWGDHRLAGLLLSAARKSCERVLLNAQLLTPDELAQSQELAQMIKIQKVSKAEAMQIKRSNFSLIVQSKCLSFGLLDL